MAGLQDVFSAPADDDQTELVAVTPRVAWAPDDEQVIEQRFMELNERREAANRAVTNRQNAATARAVAQSFSEWARAFRKVAPTKGSDVDRAVALWLAATCEEQADEYAELQQRCTTAADRAGSL